MEPIRVSEAVKIGEREFTVQELTVREIINILSGSPFIRGLSKDKGVEDKEEKRETVLDWTFFQEFSGLGGDLEYLLRLSAADFEIKDLIELTPSSIKKIVEAFKMVNADFLSTLKALGVAEALAEIRDAALSGFSRTLVTLSKVDM